MTDPDDLPTFPTSPDADAGPHAVIRMASKLARTASRERDIAAIAPDRPAITREAHLSRMLAMMDRLQILIDEEETPLKDRINAVMGWRRLSSLYATVAGHKAPDVNTTNNYSATWIAGGSEGPTYRAAGSKLEAFRREQAARLRAMDEAGPPVLEGPGADQDDEDPEDDG